MKPIRRFSTLAIIGLLLMSLGAGCDLAPQATPTVPPASTPTPTVAPTPTLTPFPTPSPTATPPPHPPPTGDPVVLFFRDDHLWLTDIQGSGVESFPSVKLPESPERSLLYAVAFYHHLLGLSPDRRWLFAGRGQWHGALLIDLHTRIARSIEQRDLESVSWSPDSRRFAFVKTTQRGPVSEPVFEPHLCIYDTTIYAESEFVTPVPDPSWVSWSPGGQYIAVGGWYTNSIGIRDTDVWIVDVVSQAAKRIGPNTGPYFEGGWIDEARQCDWVRWSVDGQQLAVRQGGGCWLVYSLADGSTGPVDPVVLETEEWNVDLRRGYLAHTALSPSGRHVARVVPPASIWEEDWWTKPSEVRIDDQKTGQTLRRWTIPGPVTIVRWSPDGVYLLLNILQTEAVVNVEEGPVRSAIWRLRADGMGKLERIVDDGFLLEVLPPRTATSHNQ